MSSENKMHGKASCEVCGNNRERCFEVLLGGERHIFDSFECAMLALTPKCALCGCRIVGHGVQVENTFYCSNLCANLHSVREYEAHVLLREQAHFPI